jgi:hypothetical protein
MDLDSSPRQAKKQQDFITRQLEAATHMRQLRSYPDPERRFNPGSEPFSARPTTRASPSHRLYESAVHPRDFMTPNVTDDGQFHISRTNQSLANKKLTRIINSLFPPFDIVSDAQFLFLLKRFGIQESEVINQIRNDTQNSEGLIEVAKLKELFLEAVETHPKRKLPRKIHLNVLAAVANEKGRAPVPGRETALSKSPQTNLRPKPAPQPKRSAVPGERFLPAFYDSIDTTGRRGFEPFISGE